MSFFFLNSRKGSPSPPPSTIVSPTPTRKPSPAPQSNQTGSGNSARNAQGSFFLNFRRSPSASPPPVKEATGRATTTTTTTVEEELARLSLSSTDMKMFSPNRLIPTKGGETRAGSPSSPNNSSPSNSPRTVTASENHQKPPTPNASASEPLTYLPPPAWDPISDFCFPVADLPVVRVIPGTNHAAHYNFKMRNFTEISHLKDGSNANVFTAKLTGEKVVIKMIREDVVANPVAVHEFETENGLLARVDHPNILRIYGAGSSPRRFMVLEWLGGGTLSQKLAPNVVKMKKAAAYHRSTFTLLELLRRGRELADALDYMHRRCHPGCMILHRDLKPDNVGFDAEGRLKLFDFGLVTAVKIRLSPTDAYEMTGDTGSRRYMAPEVVLRKPYTEKVDVYSYGILLWQMATDQIPYRDLHSEDFITLVAKEGGRPPIEDAWKWPDALKDLIRACWNHDPQLRPSFQEVEAILAGMLSDMQGSNKRTSKAEGTSKVDTTSKVDATSKV